MTELEAALEKAIAEVSVEEEKAAADLSKRIVTRLAALVQGEPIDAANMTPNELFVSYVVGLHFLETFDQESAMQTKTRSQADAVLERLDKTLGKAEAAGAKARRDADAATLKLARSQARKRLSDFVHTIHPQVQPRLENENATNIELTAVSVARRVIPQFPQSLPQSTFQESDRVARSLADGVDGAGWSAVPSEFALMHTLTGAPHNVRFEGNLVPESWGRSHDNDSLMAELLHVGGLDAASTFQIALALLVNTKSGSTDVKIDDLISRIGIEPRSTTERTVARTKVWRMLTLLGALRVVGERRMDVWDSVARKKVRLESQDPLLSVTAMKPLGTQESFDAGAPPLGVSLYAGPLVTQWKADRSVLQSVGDLLAITSIPIGRTSGAWARAIGLTLQQRWREQATRAEYGRAGDDHRVTVKFKAPFTRRELLETLRPKPTVRDVLDAPNPRRAIGYWDDAITELAGRKIIGYYGGHETELRDWKHGRQRQGWSELWLDEPLDIRPNQEVVQALSAIAESSRHRKRAVTKKPAKARCNS